MIIENIELDKLSFDPTNSRKHGRANIEAIKGSLVRFGQQKPIVVNKLGVVIAGNGTLEAARELGWRSIKVYQTDLDDFNSSAFAISDNRTAELAHWDTEALSKTLHQLREMDFDLPSIGFDTSALDNMNSDLANVTREEWSGSASGVVEDAPSLDSKPLSNKRKSICPQCQFEY